MTPPRKYQLQIGMTTSNANPTVSTTAPVLTDAVQRCVDTAAEAIGNSQGSKINLLARPSQENAKGKHTGNLKKSPLQVGIPTATKWY